MASGTDDICLASNITVRMQLSGHWMEIFVDVDFKRTVLIIVQFLDQKEVFFFTILFFFIY